MTDIVIKYNIFQFIYLHCYELISRICCRRCDVHRSALAFFSYWRRWTIAIPCESTSRNWGPEKRAQITAISRLVGTKQERFASRDRTTPPRSSLRWDWPVARNLSGLSSIFLPLFFLSRTSCLSPPCPLPPSTILDLCFLFVRLWDALGLGLYVARLRSLSLFPRSSSSLLSPSFVFLFLPLVAVSSFLLSALLLLSSFTTKKRVSHYPIYASSWFTHHGF